MNGSHHNKCTAVVSYDPHMLQGQYIYFNVVVNGSITNEYHRGLLNNSVVTLGVLLNQ